MSLELEYALELVLGGAVRGLQNFSKDLLSSAITGSPYSPCLPVWETPLPSSSLALAALCHISTGLCLQHWGSYRRAEADLSTSFNSLLAVSFLPAGS